MVSLSPKKHLEYYGRVYPDAWRLVDTFRADRGKKLPWWPDWCFCPISGAYAIVSSVAESQSIDFANPESMALINDVGIVGALAAWRVTQGVYRFDPDVYAAVINTPITGDLPHDVLFGLPEWCIYIETPGLEFFSLPLAGFFAYLEYDSGDGRKELRLVLDHDFADSQEKEACKPKLMSMAIHLGPWSLKESVEKAMREAESQSKKLGFNSVSLPLEVAEILKNEYTSLISLLLYICSVNGEIGSEERRPEKPKSKKTKKGIRIFPAPKVSVWDVGVRMGTALRRERSQEREFVNPESGAKQRNSPRPHVRRAHWHGYWSGPRDGEQKFTLHWMPPVLVRREDSRELPVTIKPVK